MLGHPRKIDFLFVCDKSEITLSDNRDLNWLPLKSSPRRKVINSRKKKIKIFIVMQIARRICLDSHANSSCKYVGFILIASKPVFLLISTELVCASDLHSPHTTRFAPLPAFRISASVLLLRGKNALQSHDRLRWSENE